MARVWTSAGAVDADAAGAGEVLAGLPGGLAGEHPIIDITSAHEAHR
jgi:hypothetical protein